MGWKEFIAELVSSLAWPTASVLLVSMFRAELAKIVQRLAKLKYKDLELDFEKVKQQSEELQAEFALEPQRLVSPVFTSLEDQILDAVERTPSAAILLAWTGLESAIASAVSRLAISPDSPSHRSPIHNIEMLKKAGRLSRKHESLLQELRMLRNKVTHERDAMLSVSEAQALNYATAAIDLMKHFETYQR